MDMGPKFEQNLSWKKFASKTSYEYTLEIYNLFKGHEGSKGSYTSKKGRKKRFVYDWLPCLFWPLYQEQ